MRFIVIASPRTGSSHLVSSLSGHPEILCSGNVFNNDKKLNLYWPADQLKGRTAALRELRRTNPAKFLDLVFDTSFGKPVVGFKIFSRQYDSALERLLADSDVRKVVLLRRNVLANYASLLLAQRNWSGRPPLPDNSAPEQSKVVFKKAEFRAYHKSYIGFYRRVLESMQSLRQNYFLLGYDEINDPVSLNGLIAFVGANPNLAIQPDAQYRHLTKQGSNSILSRFENRSAVLRFLRVNNLLHWAHEGAAFLWDLPQSPQQAPQSNSEES